MDIAVSNLAYQGLFTNRLLALPKDIGMEVYCETGSQFYWDHLLPRLMEGRSGPLCVHGPYQNIDLSREDLDYEAVKDLYKWSCALFGAWGAKHIVCHPYAFVPLASMTPGEAEKRRKICLERVVELHHLAKNAGMSLLVENMANRNDLMNQQQFLDTFAPVPELNFLMDTGHMHIQGWDMELCFDTLGSRIHGYHINDNFTDADSHLMAFEGSFDWIRFFDYYNRYTPDATLVCEYMNGPVDRIVASVERIRQHLGRTEL